MPRNRRTVRKPPPTSADVDDFGEELRFAGDRDELVLRIGRVRKALAVLPPTDRELVEVGRAAKKNFAQRFSNAIAQKTANALRADFEDILPNAEGIGHESQSKGAGGLKKLDVNYSTTRSGLELAVSVKTINFKDDTTSRYTKNVKRVDTELRAEAGDCHRRQGYAVLVALLFLPDDAASDGQAGASSLRHASNVLDYRSGRTSPKEDDERFELAFIGLYDSSGRVSFFPPGDDVPELGWPKITIPFSKVLQEIRVAYDERNRR